MVDLLCLPGSSLRLQLSLTDKVANSLALGTSPIVRSLFDPEGGMRSVRALDNVSFTRWFKSHGGSQASIDRMWDPIGGLLGWMCVDVDRCVWMCGRAWGTWRGLLRPWPRPSTRTYIWRGGLPPVLPRLCVICAHQ